MQRLIADKEDTEQVFHIIEALNGRSFEKNFYEFVESPEGQALLEKREYLPPLLVDEDESLTCSMYSPVMAGMRLGKRACWPSPIARLPGGV